MTSAADGPTHSPNNQLKEQNMNKTDESKDERRLRRARRHIAKTSDAEPTASATVHTTTDASGREVKKTLTVSKPSTKAMRELGGSHFMDWNDHILHRVMTTLPALSDEPGMPRGATAAILTGTALKAFAPKDEVEAMIAAQATALHFAAMECARRAMIPDQPSDIAARLRKDAANSARAMVDMAEALDRRRGKGPQVVRVERVVLHEGAQAVIGNVSSGAGTTLAPAPQPDSLTHAPEVPFAPSLDVKAASAPKGEGRGDD